MNIKIIYTFFIGVLLAIFVGVGIAAFYPEPKQPERPMLLKLYKLPTDPSADPAILAQIQEAQEQYDVVMETYTEQLNHYNRDVSIISLVSAILILILSLTLTRKLLVVADGLLLGGVITLLYSVVRVFGSGDDKLRFGIVTVGLAISLLLGYLEFTKKSKNKTK